jgi:hypothetical protein
MSPLWTILSMVCMWRVSTWIPRLCAERLSVDLWLLYQRVKREWAITGSSITDGSRTWKYLSTVDYISFTGWSHDGTPWSAGTITWGQYVTTALIHPPGDQKYLC